VKGKPSGLPPIVTVGTGIAVLLYTLRNVFYTTASYPVGARRADWLATPL
jgi:hypothetical protein